MTVELEYSQSIPKLEGASINKLLPAFKTKETKNDYLIKLRMFFEYCRTTPDDFITLARSDPLRAEELITAYILERKEKVSGSTVRNFVMALKLFLAMNDSDRFNWIRLGKIIPPAKKRGADMAPTAEELRKILDSSSLRMKCIVLLMLSGGMRVGAFDWLRWRDVEPMRVGRHEFAKVTVYRDEIEEYYTFCSPECYRYLLEYRGVREKAGETVGPTSPLIRDEWGSFRLVRNPAKAMIITSKTLRDQLARLYPNIELKVEGDLKPYEPSKEDLAAVVEHAMHIVAGGTAQPVQSTPQ